MRFENRILTIALFGATIAFPSLDQTLLPCDLSLEGNEEMLSLYSARPSQEQESSASVRKKIAVAVVMLTAACGLGLWLGVQMALHVY